MMEKNLKTYSREEVENATLKYFNGDELARDVWIKKYCLKDENNYYELTPDDMHRRLAKELNRIESNYPNPLSEDTIYSTLKNFKRIVPQGSPMSGIGNNLQVVSLSNCYVIGNEKDSDSYGGIMKLDQELVQLQKRRGGVGCDLSFIRPKGSPVKNSAITSTGVVPFMERFSNSTREVAQDGRRGALLESITIEHPDAEDFIDAKLTQGKVTGANVSVKLTNNFMKSIICEDNNDFIQKYPENLFNLISKQKDTIVSDFSLDDFKENGEYNITTPVYKNNGNILGYVKKINAKKLWDKIVYNAWKSAEPGILFWDNVTIESVPDCYKDLGFETKSTNPCGEIPLTPYDSCRLLALNLFGYVVNPFTNDSYFNWELFKNDVIVAQRYMDDIVDLEIEKIDKILEKIDSDPEDEFIKLYEINLWKNIKDRTIRGRRTGLGITAEGDMLAALGYIYGTENANDFSEKVHETLKLEAYRSSIIMAKERGAFPIYNAEREDNNPFIDRIKKRDIELYTQMQEFGRRNIALLTVAPTGSVSIMTQTTSGIEPVFMPIYMRRRKINPQEKDIRVDFIDGEGVAWMEYPVFHNKFEMWLEVNGYDVNVVKTMNKTQLDEIIKKSPYYKASSNDVDWLKKVEMQGRVQKHVDHSISVTINLPEDATVELVSEIYETGWRHKCKGLTVYREGSRSGVLVSSNEKEEKKLKNIFEETHAPKRPKRLKSDIHRFQNNLEKWIAVVGIKNGRPYEIFTGKLENGLSNLPNSIKECEVVKNIIEIDGFDDNNNPIKIRKKRYDIEYVDSNGVKQVHLGLSHAFNPEYWNYGKILSGLMRHGMPMIYIYELIDSLNLDSNHLNTWKNGVARVIKRYIKEGEKSKGKCPECGGENFVFKEGCLSCVDCGWSKCS